MIFEKIINFEISKRRPMLKKNIIILLMFICFSPADVFGQDYDDFKQQRGRRTKLRTEWGITAGAHYTGMKLFEANKLSIKPRIGYDAGIHMALRFGEAIAIQPELYYSYTAADISVDSADRATRIKSHAVEMPITVSIRILSPLRINIGPVFNLMNNTSYIDRDGEKQMFGNIRPTFGYTAGVSVCVIRKLLIDARFVGQFKNTLHDFEGREFRIGSYYAGLKLGYLF